METPVVYRDFRKLEGGGEELSCKIESAKVEWGDPALAHRLSVGLGRKAPVEKRITEFLIGSGNFSWEGGGHIIEWRPII